jgi:hypothetical protein
MSEELRKVQVHIEFGPILGDVLKETVNYGSSSDLEKVCNMVTRIGYAAALKKGETYNIRMELEKDV